MPFVADPALRSLAFSIVSQIVSRNDHEVITNYTISKLRWQQCINSVSATKVARAEADFIILCIEMLACLDFGIACTLLCMTYGSFCLDWYTENGALWSYTLLVRAIHKRRNHSI